MRSGRLRAAFLLTSSGGVRNLLANTCSSPPATPEREMQTSTELTARQREIWSFVLDYSDRHGYPPTVREIGEAVGLASPSTVHAHLANLERAGLLRRDPTKPRALELVGRERREAPAAAMARLPLLGQIAAGGPLLADQNIDD